MALLYLTLEFDSSIDQTVDDKGRITLSASRSYCAIVNDPTDTDPDVRYGSCADGATPRVKDPHPLSLALRCNKVSIKQNTPLKWTVECDYESPAYRDGEEGGDDNPLSQPTEIEYFDITTDEPIDEDVNGNPICTANGEPFQGVTRPISDLGIRLKKNFTSFDPPQFYLYKNTVNDGTFFGFPAGTLRIVSTGASEQYFENQPYFAVTVEIHARKPYRTSNERAWWKRIRHEGIYIKIPNPFGGSGYLIGRATDSNKEPMTTPVALKADGTMIPKPTSLTENATAEWLEFEIFETSTFTQMGF